MKGVVHITLLLVLYTQASSLGYFSGCCEERVCPLKHELNRSEEMPSNTCILRPFPCLVVLWAGLLSPSQAQQQTVTVELSQGKLQGFNTTTRSGSQSEAFLGIPFAEPPIGKLRFKPPKEAGNWAGVRDATTPHNSCYQLPDTSFNRMHGVEMWNANTNISEDCLYLNVWTPVGSSAKANSTAANLLPVMVWIYGGGFYYGTPTLDIYNGATLAAETNVIVVSINYRVGVFGFLYVPGEIQGNMGLLDQQLGLTWVSKNIERFGGDPTRVTLFGESAGAVSVHYHMLAPSSRNLFNSAILQSGSTLAPWALDGRTESERKATVLADAMNCKLNRTTKGSLRAGVASCIVKGNADDLVLNQWTPVGHIKYLPSPFAPIIDGYFLPEHPSTMIRKSDIKKCPLLVGANKDEGMFFLIYVGVDTYFNLQGPINMTDDRYKLLSGFIYSSRYPAVQTAIENHYYPNTVEDLKWDLTDALDDMSGDLMFVCPTVWAAERHASPDVFVYHFLHHTADNPWTRWTGLMHGYEIEYVFGVPLDASLNYTAAERRLSRRLMTYWTNFAASGDVNTRDGVTSRLSTWPRYSTSESSYIKLENGANLTTGRGLRTRDCQFWNTVIPDMERALDDANKQCTPGQGATSMGVRCHVISWCVAVLLIALQVVLR